MSELCALLDVIETTEGQIERLLERQGQKRISAWLDAQDKADEAKKVSA